MQKFWIIGAAIAAGAAILSILILGFRRVRDDLC